MQWSNHHNLRIPMPWKLGEKRRQRYQRHQLELMTVMGLLQHDSLYLHGNEHQNIQLPSFSNYFMDNFHYVPSRRGSLYPPCTCGINKQLVLHLRRGLEKSEPGGVQQLSIPRYLLVHSLFPDELEIVKLCNMFKVLHMESSRIETKSQLPHMGYAFVKFIKQTLWIRAFHCM